MPYLCEWSECDFASDDFDTFYRHVREHVKDFHDEKDPNYTTDSFICLWSQCLSDSCENELELISHVLFHGYHTYLKELGLRTQKVAKLSPCSLDSQARNLVPEFPTEFCCQWDKCDMATCCPRYFYRHVDGHTTVAQKQDLDDLIHCKWKDCVFTTKKRNKLKEHCRTHTHEKCFSCPNCGGLFSNKTKFMDHLRRQNTMESESYQCSHCFKYCASERILRDHMRHHVNNVKCPLCAMTCPTKSALQHHLNFRHSDEKPFPCDMCDSSFKSRNDLRRHQQTHNPVYNFSCEVENCNYVTKTLQNLRRHYKVYHEGPSGGRYECHMCGSRYSRGTGLTKHLKKQHTFHWPAGHTRFRYKEHDDGMYRLQTVRFESVELSQQLQALENENSMSEGEESEEWQLYEGSYDQEFKNITSQQYEDQLQIKRQTDDLANEADASTGPSETANVSSQPPNHQNLLDMLRQFKECQPNGDTHNDRLHPTVAFNSGTETVAFSNVFEDPNTVEKSPNVQGADSLSRGDVADHAILDLQEAAALLARLRNSGVTS